MNPMNRNLSIALACALTLPGAALAKSHHHRVHHRAPGHHRAAASTDAYHVAAFAKTPGSGGALALEHPDGRVELAFFGEKTNLRCGPSAAGPFTPCSRRNLIVGPVVADADHGVNDNGYDVWTRVDLVTTHPIADPPAPAPPSDQPPAPGSRSGDDQSTPPPADEHPAPPAVAVVDSYNADSRALALHRLNN